MRELKFLWKLLAYYIYHLSRLIPRSSHKWVFGCHFRFSDNSKYLFYEVNERYPDIRAIWIANTRNDTRLLRAQGFEAYLWWSLQGLYHAATAKVYVSNGDISDINRCLAGGVFFLNLWHGVGLKKIRWLAPQNFLRNYPGVSEDEMHSSFRFKIETFSWLFRKPELTLVPSYAQAEIFFAPMLEVPMSQILLGAYPRNSLLNKDLDACKAYIRRYEPNATLKLVDELDRFSYVYLYMPTWRNDGHDFVKGAHINWDELNSVLAKRNAVLLLKLHPHTVMDMSQIDSYSNIMNYPSECDVYTIMPFTDCLITDYSSIYSDYSLMDKEIILFVYDYEQYVKGSYELKDYDKYYPGVRAHNFEDLLTIIKDGCDCHVPKAERDFVMQFYWDSIDNGVDIVEEVKKRLN